jgi:hypothetical protein
MPARQSAAAGAAGGFNAVQKLLTTLQDTPGAVSFAVVLKLASTYNWEIYSRYA